MAGVEKATLTPKLRFPEFQNAPEWEEMELSKFAALIRERLGNNKYTLMSVAAGIGLVSQLEKFGREIAGSQYKSYLVIKNNDFAYNKSATKEYPQGFIGLYSGKEPGAVPNSIFTCFRINSNIVFPKYLDYLFFGNLHGKWLRNFITVGARAHGSLNIDNNDLLALPVPLPQGSRALEEQQKIADCLSSIDDLIAAQSQKLETLKTHKKGLMQQLFPREGETVPRLRFPEFQNAPEWEEKTLGDTCEMQAGKFISAAAIFENYGEGLYPCFGGNGLRGYTKTFNQSGKYSLIGRQGALCGNINFVDGDFYATEHAVVATPKTGISTDWLFCNLNILNLNKFATGQAQPGLSIEVLERVACAVPQGEDEQQKIADCLSSIDDLIAAQSQKLETLKTHKKGLILQLFPSTKENPL
ncbi:MAG: restriction endonuclease subunit S [Campylobacterales bacterium]